MRSPRITLSLIGFALYATTIPVAVAEPGPYPTATWEQVQDEETRWAQEGKVEAPTPPGVNRYDCVPTVPSMVSRATSTGPGAISDRRSRMRVSASIPSPMAAALPCRAAAMVRSPTRRSRSSRN
jgi:hypothetical protein